MENVAELTLRRVGVRSYLRTALPAALVVSLLYLTFFDLANPVIITRGGPGSAMSETETPRISFAIYVIVAIYLRPILSVLLWAWLFNWAARLAEGLKLKIRFDGDSLAVTRIDPQRASLIAALVAISLALVGVIVEVFATGWLAAGTLFSLNGVYLDFAHLFLTVLIQAIAAGVATWLIVRVYNRIAALSDGFGFRYCKQGPDRPALSGLVVARIRLASALRFGLLLGLAILLFRFVVSPLLPETFNLQEFLLQLSPVRALFFKATHYPPLAGMHFLDVHPFAHAHTLFGMPLWALVYNRLARRFGGLELEVEGDLPAPAPAPAPAPVEAEATRGERAMLIIRRVDVRSYLRTVGVALLLANIPLMIATMADDFITPFTIEGLSHLAENATQFANSMLLSLATNLLQQIAGVLLLVWTYNWIVRRLAGLDVVLRPAGRSLRLLRIGPKRAWGAGLLLAGTLALTGFALLLLPTQDVLRGSLVIPLLNLNLAFRLLEGSEQTRQYLTFVSYYAYSQTGDSAILQFFLVQGASLVLRATLAGGLLLWLGATLYNGFAGRGGEFALRLRAARVGRDSRSQGVTARLTRIYLSRTPRVAFVLLAAFALLLILPVIVREREATPVMLLSILRWPLALLLFNRLAPRAGGVIVHGERATPSEGPGGEGAE